ncbi:RecX family transcriptional regulator [Sporosalibacterium faouarense]|uniref:RecX family transcriptional regulator n=1 Tax=Sporosalibacterium faouarense TaxID=516123 RepID=UPI00192B541D|nr:RecX family transcriptional regulator [Sporosalibacterium faouarense]
MKKITKVEKQKRNNKRYSIYINGEYAFGVHEDTLVKYELLKGKELDNEFIDKVIKAKEQSKGNNYALKLLSYRSRSKKEIQNKMDLKGYDKSIIDNVIYNLEKKGYIDDKQFTIEYVKDKVKLKKFGKKRLEIELIKKGIEKIVIREVIENLVDKEEEYNRALEIAKKKLRTSYKNDEKRAQYRKLGGFLQRKGYDFDIVKKVLEEVL